MADLIVERDAGMLVPTMNRPERLNARTFDTREAMVNELTAAQRGPGVRANDSDFSDRNGRQDDQPDVP